MYVFETHLVKLRSLPLKLIPMNKLAFFFILILVLISCEKPGNLKTSEVIAGGCALGDKGAPAKGLTEETDKVTYTISNGDLNILVGFNATCCGQYSTSSQIKADSILIGIKTTQIGFCDCICYYTYNFTFIGTGENYKYKVTVDDNHTFTGEIKN